MSGRRSEELRVRSWSVVRESLLANEDELGGRTAELNRRRPGQLRSYSNADRPALSQKSYWG